MTRTAHDGTITVLVDNADTGFSHRPDGPQHILAFDVVDGWRHANRRVFAEISPGVADGFRVDTEGNMRPIPSIQHVERVR